MNLRETGTWSLRRNARSVLSLALLALLVHEIFGTHGFLAMRRTQNEINHLRQEIAHFSQENLELANQIQALKTDAKLIERIAREEMGLAKPGELIFKLPAPPAKAETPKR